MQFYATLVTALTYPAGYTLGVHEYLPRGVLVRVTDRVQYKLIVSNYVWFNPKYIAKLIKLLR